MTIEEIDDSEYMYRSVVIEVVVITYKIYKLDTVPLVTQTFCTNSYMIMIRFQTYTW